jgi:hypothetical protein
MQHEKDSSSNKPEDTEEKGSWGGAREGAGRKKGSINKISGKAILEEAERVLGKPFITSLLEGYQDTIINNDTKHRTVYERMLLDKVASNLFDVEVSDSEDVLAAKQAAFAEAIAQITAIPARD